MGQHIVWLLFRASRPREISSRLAGSVSYGEEIDKHRQDRDRPRRKVPGSTCETLEPKVPRPDMERDAGEHPISDRTVLITSKENVLAIALTVPDEETASRLENVVAEHLKRFAFRESLEIVWQRA